MQLIVEEAATGFVRLEPFAVDDELGDGTLANMANYLGRGGRIGIYIDFGVFNPVIFEKLLGRPAISAPRGGVDLNLHWVILPGRLRCLCDG